MQYWTGTQWALVPGGSIAGNTQVWRQLLFTPVTTTAIRITVTGTVDTWTRLTEVEAYAGAPIATVNVPNVVGLTQAAATTKPDRRRSRGRHCDDGVESDGSGRQRDQPESDHRHQRGGRECGELDRVHSGPAVTRLNVAATANGGTALASSFYSASYPPAGALDGNRRGAPWGGGTGLERRDAECRT